jgi:hypothetical protein
MWVMGNPESDGAMGGRLGTEIAQNLEIGGSILYAPSDEKTVTGQSQEVSKTVTTTTKEAKDNWNYGAYSVYHFTENLYAGGQVIIGEGDDVTSTIQPIGGVKIGPLFAEYQHESLNGEDDKILFGAIFRF